MTVKQEIKRRLKEFKNKDGFDGVKMVLLCYPSEAKKEVKEGLIIPYSKEQKRCLSWYNLTEKGVEYFKQSKILEECKEIIADDKEIKLEFEGVNDNLVKKINGLGLMISQPLNRGKKFSITVYNRNYIF